MKKLQNNLEGISPDFEIVTKTLKSFERDGKKYITGVASSSDVDLGSDRFTEKAMNQMEEGFTGLTAFLNHDYKVPDSVFGTFTNATTVMRGGIIDLDVEIQVEESNPKAVDTYNMIQNGVKFGISVGVMVDEYDVLDEKSVHGRKIMEISAVTPLEASIVGIPANRRSWVDGVRKSFIAKGVLDEDEEVEEEIIEEAVADEEVAVEETVEETSEDIPHRKPVAEGEESGDEPVEAEETTEDDVSDEPEATEEPEATDEEASEEPEVEATEAEPEVVSEEEPEADDSEVKTDDIQPDAEKQTELEDIITTNGVRGLVLAAADNLWWDELLLFYLNPDGLSQEEALTRVKELGDEASSLIMKSVEIGQRMGNIVFPEPDKAEAEMYSVIELMVKRLVKSTSADKIREIVNKVAPEGQTEDRANKSIETLNKTVEEKDKIIAEKDEEIKEFNNALRDSMDIIEDLLDLPLQRKLLPTIINEELEKKFKKYHPSIRNKLIGDK